jgi:hypothetical protein
MVGERGEGLRVEARDGGSVLEVVLILAIESSAQIPQNSQHF